MGVAAEAAGVLRLEEAREDRRRSAKSSLTPLRWVSSCRGFRVSFSFPPSDLMEGGGKFDVLRSRGGGWGKRRARYGGRETQVSRGDN